MKYGELFEMKNRSPDYRFTKRVGNPADELKYKQLRQEISDHNKSLAPHPSGTGFVDPEGNVAHKKYVQQFGRLGRNNPASSKYDPQSPDRDPTRRSPRRSQYGGPQRIHHDDATRFDVYVRNRADPRS